MDVRKPFAQCIALSLSGILFLNPIVSVAAGLALDPAAGGNATIGAAGNGVPIVNINAANGAGLSHNKFSEYNVGSNGLILNNGTGSTQNTQLGGYIMGNPNLKGRRPRSFSTKSPAAIAASWRAIPKWPGSRPG
ncbi:hypothetical protein PBOI14_07820 [Pseudomonas sp. Boi14]|nr:hypothetical protein PBOI14_07820 [Pseudomonas sp. Boi14]